MAGRNSTLVATLVAVLTAIGSFANTIAADGQGSGLEITPVRYELDMQPGSERTVVVNALYRTEASGAQTSRVIATVADWTINNEGNVEFINANSLPDSSSSWLIHSPVEFNLVPNVLQPIRVTISVPQHVRGGEYRSALIVEERPPSNKDLSTTRTLNIRYRFAVLFYVRIPDLIKRAELTGLRVNAEGRTVTVIPTIRNHGNVHLRPAASIEIVDAQGKVVFERPAQNVTVLLRDAQLEEPISFEAGLSQGDYLLRYSIDFGDGVPRQTGTTRFAIPNPAKSTAQVR